MARNKVIGLLGGGQLGRMLQEQAAPLGIEIVVLDAAECPMRQISSNPKHVAGSFNDPDKIRELARKCDILTIEIEHVNTEVLEEIATKGVTVRSGEVKKVPVHPSWETIRLIQDKFLQKAHFRTAGIPVAPQIAINTEAYMRDELQEAAQKFGFPFMLKARKGSYDGRGNFKVRNEGGFDEAISSMGKLQLYAEGWVPFEKELAVMVVRTEFDDGETKSVYAYPAVETIHEDSICTKVFYPPRQVSPEIRARAKNTAVDVVDTLKGRGIFAVEMFLLRDGSIKVNEVAPRPHNSGHLWIEAMPNMSQFKAHLYSILDILPKFLKLQPRVSAAMMLNILGGAEGSSHDRLVNLTEELYEDDVDVFLHLYGKASKPGRKIGHITATTYSPHNNLEQLVSPLTKEVDKIRQERHQAASAQTGPSSAPAPVPSEPSSTSSRSTTHPLVMITMGSDSDLPVLAPAFSILERFSVPYDYTITSAHRTPHLMTQLAHRAASVGIRVIIAAAGGAAHLPGMLASETPLPVIGVPIKATYLDGKDSLLSIVQMPRGCPVATVGIGNSTNAALLAVRILGTGEERFRVAMEGFMAEMGREVEGKAERLREAGWEEYLKEK